MEKEPAHICFTCDYADIEYDEAFGKERAFCQVPYKKASRYKEKVFSRGNLIHCPAWKERTAEAEDGGD